MTKRTMSTKLKAIRAGHRGALTKLLKRVDDELISAQNVAEITSIKEMIHPQRESDTGLER